MANCQRRKVDELQAGPELDALVAERVMGWTLSDGLWCKKLGGGLGYWAAVGAERGSRVFAPSTDIVLALEVAVEASSNSLGFGVVYIPGFKDANAYSCSFFGRTFVNAQASTAPLAICRAALKAVGVEEV